MIERKFHEFPEHETIRNRLIEMTTGRRSQHCLIVPGVTGAGKTAMYDWVRDHPISSVRIADTVHGMEYGPEALIDAFLSSLHPKTHDELVASLEAPWEQSPPFEAKVDGFLDTMRERQIQLLLIDNADACERARTPAGRRGAMSFIRTVMRSTNCNVALFGLPKVVGLVAERIGATNEVLPLGPIGDSPAYRQWLHALEADHDDGGFDGHLDDDDVALDLLGENRGFIGFIEREAFDAVHGYPYREGALPRELAARISLGRQSQGVRRGLVERVDLQWRMTQW